MTDERREFLRAVAYEIWGDGYDYSDWQYAIARAVVRLCMERAVEVVTEHYQSLSTEHRLMLIDRATAIRRLIPQEDKP